MKLKTLFIALVALGSLVVIAGNILEGTPSPTTGSEAPKNVDTTATTASDSTRQQRGRPSEPVKTSSPPSESSDPEPSSTALAREQPNRDSQATSSGATAPNGNSQLNKLQQNTQDSYNQILGEEPDEGDEDNALDEERLFRKNEKLRDQTKKSYNKILDN
jgi:hypothetical protein